MAWFGQSLVWRVQEALADTETRGTSSIWPANAVAELQARVDRLRSRGDAFRHVDLSRFVAQRAATNGEKMHDGLIGAGTVGKDAGPAPMTLA